MFIILCGFILNNYFSLILLMIKILIRSSGKELDLEKLIACVLLLGLSVVGVYMSGILSCLDN